MIMKLLTFIVVVIAIIVISIMVLSKSRIKGGYSKPVLTNINNILNGGIFKLLIDSNADTNKTFTVYYEKLHDKYQQLCDAIKQIPNNDTITYYENILNQIHALKQQIDDLFVQDASTMDKITKMQFDVIKNKFDALVIHVTFMRDELVLLKQSDALPKQSDAFRVLIYCHPKKILLNDDNTFSKDMDNSHWQSKYIEHVIKQRNIDNKPVLVETLDPSTSSHNQATYKIDGFNAGDINKLKNLFDVVFLPDCGGKWAEHHLNNKTIPISLFDIVLNIVKKDGFLYASKLYNDSDAYDIAKKILLNKGYKTDIEKYDLFGIGDIIYIIIKKNNSWS